VGLPIAAATLLPLSRVQKRLPAHACVLHAMTLETNFGRASKLRMAFAPPTLASPLSSVPAIQTRFWTHAVRRAE